MGSLDRHRQKGTRAVLNSHIRSRSPAFPTVSAYSWPNATQHVFVRHWRYNEMKAQPDAVHLRTTTHNEGRHLISFVQHIGPAGDLFEVDAAKLSPHANHSPLCMQTRWSPCRRCCCCWSWRWMNDAELLTLPSATVTTALS